MNQPFTLIKASLLHALGHQTSTICVRVIDLKLNKKDIAARIRGLLAGQDHEGDHARAALRLRVDEVALRLSVDELAPQPTIDVIAAVIREYGVDPSWLLTGAYDSATHRRVLADETTAAEAVSEILSGALTPLDGIRFPRIVAG